MNGQCSWCLGGVKKENKSEVEGMKAAVEEGSGPGAKCRADGISCLSGRNCSNYNVLSVQTISTSVFGLVKTSAISVRAWRSRRRNQARSGESQNKFLLSPLEPHTSEIQTTDRALQRNRLISKVQQNRHSKDTDRVGCWPSVKQKERESNSFTSQWENRGTQTNW